MFCNIMAEMARKQISKQEMADFLGISVKTFERKIKNTANFSIREIFAIQKVFNNSECTFEYLLFNAGEKMNG